MNEQQFRALPLDQRKAHQERLQALGLYAGKIDGNWGAGTKSAFDNEAKRASERAERERTEKSQREERERADKLEQERINNERLRLETERGKADTGNAEAEAKLARQQTYNEQQMSPLGLATQSAASVGAPALGTAAGYRLGGLINERMNEGQEGRNVALRGVADDRIKGLTTREGAIAGARLAGAMPSQNALLRVGGRMGPHLGLGALSAAKGVELLSDYDEDQPFYPRMADRAAGLAYLGFGGGLVKRGIEQAASPGVSPDAQALAVINSNQLRRNGIPSRAAADRGQIIDAEVVSDQPQSLPAPENTGPQPGSKAYYVQEAKRLGVKGATRKSKADLVQAVNEANAGNATKRVRGPRKLPAFAGPVGAATVAYMATPEDAYASTGDASLTGQDRAITNAAAAGGLTYGTNKLLQALPSGTGTLAGGMTGPLMPMTFDPFEGGSEEDTRHNIMAARGDLNALLPSAGRAIGVTPQEQSAYEMAQVPTPSSSRVQRQADTRQDAEYMRRYLDDEPVNMPVSVPGWQDRAATAPDPFDADLAELASLLAELEGPAEPQRRSAPVVMPNPVMVSPALQNRLLAGR